MVLCMCASRRSVHGSMTQNSFCVLLSWNYDSEQTKFFIIIIIIKPSGGLRDGRVDLPHRLCKKIVATKIKKMLLGAFNRVYFERLVWGRGGKNNIFNLLSMLLDFDIGSLMEGALCNACGKHHTLFIHFILGNAPTKCCASSFYLISDCGDDRAQAFKEDVKLVQWIVRWDGLCWGYFVSLSWSIIIAMIWSPWYFSHTRTC